MTEPERRTERRRAGDAKGLRRRATDRVRAPQAGIYGRLRLRHKLAVSLALAALLPVVLASTVALRLVLAGLRSGARAQTERTLMVAVNLMLSHVKEVFEQTVRVSEQSGLAETLLIEPGSQGAIGQLLQRRDEQLFPGLVEVAEASGKIVARRTIGGIDGKPLEQSDNAEPIARALRYERHVTIARVGSQLVLRSAAPIVDRGFQLRGAVVLSVPLDAAFADRLKAQLSVDVVIYVDGDAAASSFIAPNGARERGLPLQVGTQTRVLQQGESWFEEVAAHGQLYSVGVAPIQNEAGTRLGMLGVAVDEADVLRARGRAWRSILLGAAAAVLFALLLAAELSRRITRPLAYLHAGAVAVAQGDLDQEMVPHSGDELGDLAVAFSYMIQRIKENQGRLALRMKEIVTLHEIGRAVSSVLALNEVLGKVTEQVSQVFSAERAVLWLVADYNDQTVEPGAAVGIADPRELNRLARAILDGKEPVRLERMTDNTALQETAPTLQATLIAAPLEEKDRVLGLLVVLRDEKNPFADTDLRLLATVAGQAATAISNAGLYAALQRSSEELEHKVDERTLELVMANQELEKAITDLVAAQAALVHSERMAGLGVLVAGVAHEVNSPAAAIRGAVDNLADNVSRLASRARELGEIGISHASRRTFFTLVEQLAPTLATAKLESPLQVRRQSKLLAERLDALGLPGVDAECRTLVEIGAQDAAYQLAQLATTPYVPSGTTGTFPIFSGATPPSLPALPSALETAPPLRQRSADDTPPPVAPGQHSPTAQIEARILSFSAMVAYLEQYAYLFRNTHAIRTAIAHIVRIVGALKGYSHLDQARITPSDIHEGIENTLIILQSELKYGINIQRHYAELPAIPLYVDELNQVWTNLIHNAVQACGGKGDIDITTSQTDEWVTVVIEDNGPGIPAHLMPKIFEPFFTTKQKGEGTGLGLPIVRQIVDKHGGKITVESRPGCTRFTVSLPISGPPVRPVEGPR